jgi:hypothetical protein
VRAHRADVCVNVDAGQGEMSVRTSEMSELLDEMRRLRHELERSINKQNELQTKLDENIRQTRTPREFTFSGRGVSYSDVRLVDASGSFVDEHQHLSTNMSDEKRSRPLGSSTTELGRNDARLDVHCRCARLDIERTRSSTDCARARDRSHEHADDVRQVYVVADVDQHEQVCRAIVDAKHQLKSIEMCVNEQLRTTSVRLLVVLGTC